MKQLLLGLAMTVVVAVWVACGSSGGIGLQPGINGCTSFTDATPRARRGPSTSVEAWATFTIRSAWQLLPGNR